MNDLLSSYETAILQIERVAWSARDIFGGILLVILTMVLARIFLRAVIESFCGRQNGSVVAGITEIILACFILSKAYQNPGIILASVGWSAAVFRQLWISYIRF